MKRMRFGVTGCLAVGLLFCAVSQAAAADLTEGWSGDVFFGYNKSSGNTNSASGTLSAKAVKKFEHSEFTLKGNVFYAESDKKMDTQKWDVLSRYSRDFGKEYRWYNFFQNVVDHDYFADIDYRITPAAGLGYHVYRTEDLTWDVDGGLGYRITRHRVNTGEDDEVMTAMGHTFIKKKILENAFVSEDFSIYPGLESNSGVILRSESVFSNPLMKNLDLEVKYIVDYNSEPGPGTKKTDSQFVVGAKYTF